MFEEDFWVLISVGWCNRGRFWGAEFGLLVFEEDFWVLISVGWCNRGRFLGADFCWLV